MRVDLLIDGLRWHHANRLSVDHPDGLNSRVLLTRVRSYICRATGLVRAVLGESLMRLLLSIRDMVDSANE